MLTRAALRHPMTEEEYRRRYARSQALMQTSINLSFAGTVIGGFCIAWWPLAIPALTLVCASVLVSRWARRVSPFK